MVEIPPLLGHVLWQTPSYGSIDKSIEKSITKNAVMDCFYFPKRLLCANETEIRHFTCTFTPETNTSSLIGYHASEP